MFENLTPEKRKALEKYDRMRLERGANVSDKFTELDRMNEIMFDDAIRRPIPRAVKEMYAKSAAAKEYLEQPQIDVEEDEKETKLFPLKLSEMSDPIRIEEIEAEKGVWPLDPARVAEFKNYEDDYDYEKEVGSDLGLGRLFK